MSRTTPCIWLFTWLATGALAVGPAAAGQDGDDAFLRGYVSAKVEPIARVVAVEDGIVYLDAETPPSVRVETERRVRDVAGVRAVRWIEAGDTPPVGASPGPYAYGEGPGSGSELLPSRTLFEPLSADPRWPRFSATIQRYRDDPELGKVGAVSLGGTLPIWQDDLPGEGRWELAIQGSVFSIFDLDQSGLDLVNSDFFAGFPIYARWSWFSLMVRPYHQSSHLGDEFLLRDRVERIDVSVEGVDALISIDILDFARIYGGGGILLHREPEDLARRSVQAGIELTSPIAFFGGRVRPIASLDVTRQEENDWDSDYSARAGFQLENGKLLGGRRLQILAEYYQGFSPNGQFFRRRIEYFGVGLHFHF